MAERKCDFRDREIRVLNRPACRGDFVGGEVSSCTYTHTSMTNCIKAQGFLKIKAEANKGSSEVLL